MKMDFSKITLATDISFLHLSITVKKSDEALDDFSFIGFYRFHWWVGNLLLTNYFKRRIFKNLIEWKKKKKKSFLLRLLSNHTWRFPDKDWKENVRRNRFFTLDEKYAVVCVARRNFRQAECTDRCVIVETAKPSLAFCFVYQTNVVLYFFWRQTKGKVKMIFFRRCSCCSIMCGGRSSLVSVLFNRSFTETHQKSARFGDRPILFCLFVGLGASVYFSHNFTNAKKRPNILVLFL